MLLNDVIDFVQVEDQFLDLLQGANPFLFGGGQG